VSLVTSRDDITALLKLGKAQNVRATLRAPSI
jgi:hypothetical protein